MNSLLKLIVVFFSFLSFSTTRLDKSLKPINDQSQLGEFYKSKGLIAGRHFSKAKDIIFSIYGNREFSDVPIGSTGISFDVGYAFNENWELYLHSTPFFLLKERTIVQLVDDLNDSGGNQATIDMYTPKYEAGLNLLWLPGYGKDSLSSKKAFHHDLFLKLGVAYLATENEFGDADSGISGTIGFGKTFFMGQNFGFRLASSYNFRQVTINNDSSLKHFFILEGGINLYL